MSEQVIDCYAESGANGLGSSANDHGNLFYETRSAFVGRG